MLLLIAAAWLQINAPQGMAHWHLNHSKRNTFKNETKNLKVCIHTPNWEGASTRQLTELRIRWCYFHTEQISRRWVEGCRSNYHQGSHNQNTHFQETACWLPWLILESSLFEHWLVLGRQEVASNMNDIWKHVWNINTRLVLDFSGLWKMKTILV